MKLGLVSFAFSLVLLSCTPAEQQKLRADVPTVESVVAKFLTAENYACLAAQFLPGVQRAEAIALCSIVQPLTKAADDWLKSVEAKRSPTG